MMSSRSLVIFEPLFVLIHVNRLLTSIGESIRLERIQIQLCYNAPTRYSEKGRKIYQMPEGMEGKNQMCLSIRAHTKSGLTTKRREAGIDKNTAQTQIPFMSFFQATESNATTQIQEKPKKQRHHNKACNIQRNGNNNQVTNLNYQKLHPTTLINRAVASKHELTTNRSRKGGRRLKAHIAGAAVTSTYTLLPHTWHEQCLLNLLA